MGLTRRNEIEAQEREAVGRAARSLRTAGQDYSPVAGPGQGGQSGTVDETTGNLRPASLFDITTFDASGNWILS